MTEKKTAWNRLYHGLFDELIEFAKTMTWKKALLAILGMIFLGTSVALIQSTYLGMSSWDAVNRNIYENTPLPYSIITPIIAVVLMTFAHLIAWKKPSIMFFFPLLISFFIGGVIDIDLLFMPSMLAAHWTFNVIYLIIASIFVAVGLNLMLYVNFPLPALDRFCLAISERFHLTFGQGKYIGEALAVIGAVGLGLIYQEQSNYFYLGYTTVYYVLALGYVVDFIRKPLYKLFGAKEVEIYADDLLESDIDVTNVVQASRALIIRKKQILLLHYQKDDFYLIPGGTREKGESLERCLKREILEETGLSIKIYEQRLALKEYFPGRTHENHYFICKLKSQKIREDKINRTKEEQEADIKLVWIDIPEAIDLLANHECDGALGMHMMYREFIALISAL